MAETLRTLEYFYQTIRDRLGLLHSDNMNYQEATFVKDAQTVGQHIHSLLVSAGERYWDTMSGTASISTATEYSSLFPNDTDEVAMIRNIWLLGDDGKLLMTLENRRTGRADIDTGSYPSYEVIDNKVYWFPKPSTGISVKVEYVAAYDSTPATGTWDTDNQVWGGSTAGSDIDETGDEPDLPGYADDYFLNELTVRAAIATGRDPTAWMNLAMRSRESMVLNARRHIPRRRHVSYRGY